MNELKKLESLSTFLYKKNLVTEAALVGHLYNDFHKEAGVMDAALEAFNQVMNNPEIIDNISMGIKLASAISMLVGVSTGAGAAAGVGIGQALMKASSGLDIVAAAGYYKNNQIRKCLMNILSAILSFPSAWLSKITTFLLSEDFVSMILKYKQLKRNHDTASLLAAQISEYIEKTVPTIMDGLIAILDGLMSAIIPVAKSVAQITGQSSQQVAENIGAELKQLSASLSSVSRRISA